MAPVKFRMCKAWSRDHPDPPSTENVLQCSASSERVRPESSIPLASKDTIEDLHSPDISTLQLDSDDDDNCSEPPTRRVGHSSAFEDPLMNYHEPPPHERPDASDDDASTSCDVNSILFDQSSIAPSEDPSVYCLKKHKKPRTQRASDVELMQALKKNKKPMTEQQLQYLRDMEMWRASDAEVIQNLLRCSYDLNEKFKWEAIATARGLCTLNENCTCVDCERAIRARYLAGGGDANPDIADGGIDMTPLCGHAVEIPTVEPREDDILYNTK